MSDTLKRTLGEGWYNHLSPFFDSDKFKEIKESLRKSPKFAPYPKNIFKAFELTKWEDVKVIILDKEPYSELINIFNSNTKVPLSTGLAFGISDNIVYTPPSLDNIMKEIEKEYDVLLINGFDYTLESWAKQGVLLLNTALSCEFNNIGSHVSLWKPFTDYVIQTIAENKTGLIWLLWGNHSKGYKKYINEKFHHVLESGHPSLLSANRGFWFNNGHFKKTNEILESMNSKSEIIKWYE